MISIKIDSTSSVPVYRQVYEGIRTFILDGTLRPGQRVPSTRELSKLLSISRTTASQAYDYLISEGYLATTRASRTYVRPELPEAFLAANSATVTVVTPASEPTVLHTPKRIPKSAGHYPRVSHTEAAGEPLHHPLSALALSLIERSAPESVGAGANRALINISSNSPSVRDFPLSQWRSCVNRVLRNCGSGLLEYSSPEGCIELRKAISRYLQISRGVVCAWEQVVVTFASKQALDLVCRLHLKPDTTVAIEDPGYAGAIAAFRASGCRLAAIPVDTSGLVISNLARAKASPKLVYTTPSHQYPTGGTMPLDRRIELLRWTSEAGALIIEDDYDSEFRYAGHPVPALQGLARGRGVIYVGTLSKILFPSLRLGYIVVPPELQNIYRQAQCSIYGDPPVIAQEAAALLMNSGGLERHIRKMRLLYAHRRSLALDVLTKHFGGELSIIGDAAGLHFVVRFKKNIDKHKFESLCADRGFLIRDTDTFYIDQRASRSNEYIFGFGRLNESEIELSAAAMNDAYKRSIR